MRTTGGNLKPDNPEVIEAHKKKIPVVVFSASENEEDVNRSFSLGAREFIHKPMDLEEYKSVVCGMVQKWVPREQTGGQFR